MSDQHVEQEHPVRPLELFFDLVFVFGFTQVTTVLSDDPTWGGLWHGLLILAALWWAWAACAWLTNTVDPDEGAVWGAILVAMAAMFVAALAGRPRRLRPSRFGIAPMVAGIVLFAFATKATLAHVGDELDTIPALGLCGGPALYLLAYVALRLGVSRTLGRGRLVAAVACALLVPVAVVVPTLVALVAVVWVALHAYEIICWREARARTRALRLPAFVS